MRREIEEEDLLPREDRSYYAAQLRQCLTRQQRNEQLFDLETEPELIDAHIYRRLALQCEYRYLLRKVRQFSEEKKKARVLVG